MSSRPTDLGKGVLRYQSPQWLTNSVVVGRDCTSIAVDPAWTPVEITSIHDLAQTGGRSIDFLLTHADPDHVCGMNAFSDATIHVEARSARLIDEGFADAVLQATGVDWNMEFAFQPHYDRVIEVGCELVIGECGVVTIDAAGHVLDGVAYLFIDEGVLVPGDNLCNSMSPLISWSTTHASATIRRLMDAIERFEVRWVVPGHGSVLSPAEALRIGTQDIAYLDALAAAAVGARESGHSWAEALQAVLRIPQPRPNTGDIEIYAPRYLNARRALVDAQVLRPNEHPPPVGF